MLGAVKRAIAKPIDLDAEGSRQRTNTESPRLQNAHSTAKVDLECATPDSMTPLMRAACNGALDIVQDLLTRGVDVNAQRNDGFTALALAAFFGHFRIVELLLERGADVEATCRFGTSAEMWASARGFVGITESLKTARLHKNVRVSAAVTSLAEQASTIQLCEDEGSQELGCASEPSDGDDLEVTREVRRIATDVAQERVEHVVSGGTPRRLVGKQTESPKQNVINPAYRIPDSFPDTPKPTNENSQFRPGLIFLARITSSRKNLAQLTLIVMIICGVATFAILKTGAEFSSDHKQHSAIKEIAGASQLPAESGPNVSSEQKNSDRTSSLTSSARIDSASPAVKAEGGSSANERKSKPDKSESDKSKQPKASPAEAGNRNLHVDTDLAAKNRISPDAKKRSSAPPPTLPVVTSERRTVSLTAVAKQPAPDIESKPAPLIVEVSRPRIVSSSASTNENQRPGGQSTGSTIISAKPKSKVIQWP